MKGKIAESVDEYIENCIPEIKPTLQKLRQTILEAAPEASEKISWGMATFVYHGNLVHFSAAKNHIGFHPAPSGIEAFREELAEYHTSKGTIQFPFDKPLPFDLVRKIVLYRVKEQAALAEAKKTAKNKSV